MPIIPFDEVQRFRAQIMRANVLAADRFRKAFDKDPHVHLVIQAEALLETASFVSLREGPVRYQIDENVVTPYVRPGLPIYPFFDIAPDHRAILEYWMIISELTGSASWRVTKLIASSEEYDEALRRMQMPQLVRALIPALLPSADLLEDGRATLEVTLHSRAGEERLERRHLTLENNEFVFHSRELLAEGRGGIAV